MNSDNMFFKNFSKMPERISAEYERTELSFEKMAEIIENEYGVKISVSALKGYQVSDPFNSRADMFRGMSVERLLTLAALFNVSPDYLLGISEIRSPTDEGKSLHAKTGLTPKAVEAVSARKDDPIYTKGLSYLIENGELLDAIIEYSNSEFLNRLSKDEGFRYLPKNMARIKDADKTLFAAIMQELGVFREKATKEHQDDTELVEQILRTAARKYADLSACQELWQKYHGEEFEEAKKRPKIKRYPINADDDLQTLVFGLIEAKDVDQSEFKRFWKKRNNDASKYNSDAGEDLLTRTLNIVKQRDSEHSDFKDLWHNICAAILPPGSEDTDEMAQREQELMESIFGLIARQYANYSYFLQLWMMWLDNYDEQNQQYNDFKTREEKAYAAIREYLADIMEASDE
ncbi:hypothetical protein LJB89_02940 [Tyzzerella sp. OttesenSCG-928-J15]|nr:hypothetical protein [Tyzzerella sp. OttesenSCG-928-J15]